MVDIATRQTQLRPLSHAQVDNNFINLKAAVESAQQSADGTLVSLAENDGASKVGTTWLNGTPGALSDLSLSKGSSLIGFIQSGIGAVVQAIQDALRERFSPKQFGAKFDGVTDDGPAFNRAILELAKAGGGVLNVGGGIAKIVTPILWPSNVDIVGFGCTLVGTGVNTLIKSGALVAGALVDITTEYGTGAQGAGTNLVMNATIRGVRLSNAAIGIRGHRMNYGSNIRNVIFDASLTTAFLTSHSWGLSVKGNLIYSPPTMMDFVDWTVVEGNSFEGPYGNTPPALTIATGGYGGSYSLSIRNNGFHHFSKGIVFACEADNSVIELNHFEDIKLMISGGAQTVQNIAIRNNWMKANLATPAACTAISFPSAWNPKYGPNFYSTDGASTWATIIDASNSNSFGWDIPLAYSPASTLDISQYTLNDCGTVTLRGGSNDPSKTQPTIEVVSGSSGWTVEKYKSRYHAVANVIPYCTVTYSGTSAVIDTWITCDAFGTRQFVALNLLVNGDSAYQLTGFIAALAFSPIANIKFFGSGGTLIVTISNNAGKLRISIAGAPSGGNITGWIKEM